MHPLVVVEVAVLAVLGFLLGSVNPATLVARTLGRDLRTSGSGNPGATNAGRVLGWRWGVLVLVLDVAKAYLPTLLVLRALGTWPALATGLAVVLGHVFSPFLRGRGGKGVACAVGAIAAVEPWLALAGIGMFLLAKVVLSMIGEASVVATGGLLLVGLVAVTGVVPGVDRVVGAWVAVLCLVVLFRHRRNIRAWWVRHTSRA